MNRWLWHLPGNLSWKGVWCDAIALFPWFPLLHKLMKWNTECCDIILCAFFSKVLLVKCRKWAGVLKARQTCNISFESLPYLCRCQHAYNLKYKAHIETLYSPQIGGSYKTVIVFIEIWDILNHSWKYQGYLKESSIRDTQMLSREKFCHLTINSLWYSPTWQVLLSLLTWCNRDAGMQHIPIVIFYVALIP